MNAETESANREMLRHDRMAAKGQVALNTPRPVPEMDMLVGRVERHAGRVDEITYRLLNMLHRVSGADREGSPVEAASDPESLMSRLSEGAERFDRSMNELEEVVSRLESCI